MQTLSYRAEFRSNRGFTLIELMLSVAIVGVLSSIVIPVFGTFLKWAETAGLKGYASSLIQQQKMFYLEHDIYSSDLSVLLLGRYSYTNGGISEDTEKMYSAVFGTRFSEAKYNYWAGINDPAGEGQNILDLVNVAAVIPSVLDPTTPRIGKFKSPIEANQGIKALTGITSISKTNVIMGVGKYFNFGTNEFIIVTISANNELTVYQNGF